MLSTELKGEINNILKGPKYESDNIIAQKTILQLIKHAKNCIKSDQIEEACERLEALLGHAKSKILHNMLNNLKDENGISVIEIAAQQKVGLNYVSAIIANEINKNNGKPSVPLPEHLFASPMRPLPSPALTRTPAFSPFSPPSEYTQQLSVADDSETLLMSPTQYIDNEYVKNKSEELQNLIVNGSLTFDFFTSIEFQDLEEYKSILKSILAIEISITHEDNFEEKTSVLSIIREMLSHKLPNSHNVACIIIKAIDEAGMQQEFPLPTFRAQLNDLKQADVVPQFNIGKNLFNAFEAVASNDECKMPTSELLSSSKHIELTSSDNFQLAEDALEAAISQEKEKQAQRDKMKENAIVNEVAAAAYEAGILSPVNQSYNSPKTELLNEEFEEVGSDKWYENLVNKAATYLLYPRDFTKDKIDRIKGEVINELNVLGWNNFIKHIFESVIEFNPNAPLEKMIATPLIEILRRDGKLQQVLDLLEFSEEHLENLLNLSDSSFDSEHHLNTINTSKVDFSLVNMMQNSEGGNDEVEEKQFSTLMPKVISSNDLESDRINSEEDDNAKRENTIAFSPSHSPKLDTIESNPFIIENDVIEIMDEILSKIDGSVKAIAQKPSLIKTNIAAVDYSPKQNIFESEQISQIEIPKFESVLNHSKVKAPVYASSYVDSGDNTDNAVNQSKFNLLTLTCNKLKDNPARASFIVGAAFGLTYDLLTNTHLFSLDFYPINSPIFSSITNQLFDISAHYISANLTASLIAYTTTMCATGVLLFAAEKLIENYGSQIADATKNHPKVTVFAISSFATFTILMSPYCAPFLGSSPILSNINYISNAFGPTINAYTTLAVNTITNNIGAKIAESALVSICAGALVTGIVKLCGMNQSQAVIN